MICCKRIGIGFLLAGMIWMGAADTAHAAKLQIVMKDGLWGGAIGALLGFAQILLLENREGEENRILVGAGLGIIVGVGFGIADASGALATYDADRDRLVVGIPAPRFVTTAHGSEMRLTLLELPF